MRKYNNTIMETLSVVKLEKIEKTSFLGPVVIGEKEAVKRNLFLSLIGTHEFLTYQKYCARTKIHFIVTP